MPFIAPKAENGLPKPIFDAKTGEIDHDVAEIWKKYDFKLYALENWATLGPKVQGKIYIWMGDMDNFYLNIATRTFDAFLKTTENPKSDAEIVFTATEGHCQQFSHRRVCWSKYSRGWRRSDNSIRAWFHFNPIFLYIHFHFNRVKM